MSEDARGLEGGARLSRVACAGTWREGDMVLQIQVESRCKLGKTLHAGKKKFRGPPSDPTQGKGFNGGEKKTRGVANAHEKGQPLGTFAGEEERCKRSMGGKRTAKG